MDDRREGPDGTVTHVENRIRWAANHKAIEFNTDFDGKPHYNGFYAYDPARKIIGFWYTDTEGNLSIGTAVPESGGKAFRQDFEIMKPSGQTDHLRSTITRDGNDAYLFTVFGNREGGWKQIFELRYTRK